MKLRQCPFCGHYRQIVLNEDIPYGNCQFSITCHNCGAGGPREDTFMGAVDAWNKRFKGQKGIPDSMHAEVMQYYLDGNTLRETGLKFAFSEMTLHRFLNKLGLLRTKSQSAQIARSKGRLWVQQ